MREMMDGIGFSKEKWVKVRFFKNKIFIFAKEFIPMVKIWWSQMVIMAMQVILLKKKKIKQLQGLKSSKKAWSKDTSGKLSLSKSASRRDVMR